MRTAKRLSSRELEVARLAATGLTCKEVADRLYLSTNTVKTHLEHVYVKLGIKNRVQLARVMDAPPRSLN